MKVQILKFILISVFLGSISCSQASRNIYKLHEQGKSGVHTHLSMQNGEKIEVEIGKHLLEGSSKYIWYKLIKQKGKPSLRYSKSNPSQKWQLLPKGCAALEPTKSKNVDKCADGWEIGKVIARTITYLALHRGHMEIGSQAKTFRGSVSRKKSVDSQVDMDEVAESIRKVVNKTAKCIKHGLSLTG